MKQQQPRQQSRSGQPDEAWRQWIERAVAAGALLSATFSQPRRKDGEAARKITVRPIRRKNDLVYQFEKHIDHKVYHENVPEQEAAARLMKTMADYRQALMKSPEADVQLLASKKGDIAMLQGKPTGKQEPQPSSHNRVKSYLIPEGEPADFLVRLGVMTPDGRVVKAKYDKFRQINRFLEMVADVLPALPRDRLIKIVDFGCGKSYLTFALYHLLAIRENLPVRIAGLDLKADVIRDCNRLAADLGWDNLSFAIGDIADYREESAVDMVVTLHACDTATDAALLQAIGWGAAGILSVPCCQHELFRQIDQPALGPLLKHGILKERFAALATDAIRANLLEAAGYRTQIMEFIDMAHTPKNLLIRAVKSADRQMNRTEALRQYESFRDFLSVDPFMGREWTQRAGLDE